MGKSTLIDWADDTWNIARGCSVVSEGCVFCYMMRDSLDGTRYNPTAVTKTKSVFNLPLSIKEPGRRVFTSSLTDFFHEGCDPFRLEAFDIIRRCPHLTFQILTKRPERIVEALRKAIYEALFTEKENPALKEWLSGWLYGGNPPANVWLGTTCENQKRANQRLPILLDIPAVVHFASVEPMLEAVDLRRWLNENNGLDNHLGWVIIGGETGFGKKPLDPAVKWRYRECHEDWILGLASQCVAAEVPVFIKQMGTHLCRKFGLTGKGNNPAEWPEFIPRLRQFPTV